MRRVLTAFFLALALLGCALASSAPRQQLKRGEYVAAEATQAAEAQRRKRGDLSARDIAKSVFPSLVLLVTENAQRETVSLGSGFFVGDGLIATNHHVIEGASQVYVKMVGSPGESLVDRLLREKEQGIGVPAEIIATDQERDLAVLRVEGIRARPLLLAKDDRGVAVGDVVYVAGNPEGLEGTFSQGIVSGLRGKSYIQITAPISHGSSGGPVMNTRGEVIGVAVGTIGEGQNLNFAISASHVLPLLTKSTTVSGGPKRRGAPTAIFTDKKQTARIHYNQGMRALRERGREDTAEQEIAANVKAILAFQKAIELDPEYVEAYIFMGIAYTSLFLQDSHRAAKGNRVAAKFAAADLELARKAYNEAIRINPNDPQCFYSLGSHYLRLQEYQKAVEPLRRAIKLSPEFKSGYAYKMLGDAYIGLHQAQEAFEAYQQYVAINPDSFWSHESLGWGYMALKRFSDAVGEFKQAIKLAEARNHSIFVPSLYADLGNAYIFAEHYEEAIQAYRRAIKENLPFFDYRDKSVVAGWHAQLGSLYSQLRRYQEAIDACKQAISLDPNLPDSHFTLGLIYWVLGDKDSALQEYKILKSLDEQLAKKLFDAIYP